MSRNWLFTALANKSSAIRVFYLVITSSCEYSAQNTCLDTIDALDLITAAPGWNPYFMLHHAFAFSWHKCQYCGSGGSNNGSTI